MKWILIPLAIAIFFCSAGSSAEVMSPGKYKAPLRYALRLPKFCYGQYFGKSGANYTIHAKDCGYGMNHYCPALVSVIESEDVTIKQPEKIDKLKRALTEINYTISAMKDYPTCSLRRHVELSKAKVSARLAGAGIR